MIDDFQQEIEDKRLILKKDIKITGSNCAKILLILAISTYAIGLVSVLIIKIVNRIFNLSTALGFSQDVKGLFLGYLPCIIGDIIAITIALRTTKIKIKKELFSKVQSSKKFILLGTVSCIGTGIISSMLYAMYAIILKIAGITIPQPDFSLPKQGIYLTMFLIYVCLLGPILEEIIFRGFILKSMRRYGNLTAIIVSSILFSMFHLNLVQFVNPVLMGIVLAFIAIKSESIIPSIIAHIFNNTITFAMTGVSSLKMPLLYALVASIYVLVGIILFILFIYNYKGDFIEVIKEDTAILKTFEKIKFSFSGGWALAYIIFYVIFIIVTTVITNVFK